MEAHRLPKWFLPALLFVLLCLPQVLAADESQTRESTPPAACDAQDVKLQIERIDQKLILFYIDLARYDNLFYGATTHRLLWKSWGYPIFRESGTATSLAGSITDMSQRARGLWQPGRISRPSLRRATFCSLTGNAISGGASALELAQNAFVTFQTRKKGYSPRAAITHVRSILNQTNSLLEKRDKLVAQIAAEKVKEIRSLESQVFREMQEQLEFGFRKWSCFSRELLWRENTFYVLDALQNFTNVSASICSLKAYKNPYLRRPSAILSLASSTTAALNPLIAQVVGKAINRHEKKELARDFPIEKPELPEEISVERIKALKLDVGQTEDIDLSKIAFLASRARRIDHSLESDIKRIDKMRSVAQQKAISGPIIGMASVSRSILENVAVFSYANRKVTSTRLLFAGRIPQEAGQTYAIANTVKSLLVSHIQNHQKRMKGEMPDQVIARRLKDLDELEELVRSNKAY